MWPIVLIVGAMAKARDNLGMAHGGRVNVLSQVLRKPHRAIFNDTVERGWR